MEVQLLLGAYHDEGSCRFTFFHHHNDSEGILGQINGILLIKGRHANFNATLNHMFAALKHRGEDSRITLLGNNLAIGMSNTQNDMRNLSKANRTLEINKSDAGIYAFVDGVVLNIPELVKYFRNNGYAVRESSCSAIVTAAYDRWGLNFMDYLEGEFSCVVWDKKNQRCIMTRDPFGHKPLHYYIDENKLILSSEIKGILAAGVMPEIDILSLSDFLSLNRLPNPATFFKNIKQVPPGCTVIFSKKRITTHRYWNPRFEVDESLDFDSAILQLEDEIKNAVKKRLLTKDIYCFLSGGIDSSTVLSFAAELSGRPVHAITAGFKEEEVNELEYAKVIAKYLKVKHHHVLIKDKDFFDTLDKLVFHRDSPFTDTAAYPLYHTAEFAKRFTDVILTGDGPDQTIGCSGDNIFALQRNLLSGGAEALQLFLKFNYEVFKRLYGKPAFTVFFKNLYKGYIPAARIIYNLNSYFPDIVKRFLCSDDIWDVHTRCNPYKRIDRWFKEVGKADSLNKFLFVDMKSFVADDIMVNLDRMCMAHGLETVSPFHDLKVCRFLNKLPTRYKIKFMPDGQVITKFILRTMSPGRLPEPVLSMRKHGFDVPLEKWLKSGSGKFLREILFDSSILKRGYFKKDHLIRFVEDFIHSRGVHFPPRYTPYAHPRGIVALLTLELWHRRYIE